MTTQENAERIQSGVRELARLKAVRRAERATPKRRYSIVSTGNGATFTLTRLADGETRFLQGSDAFAFDKELSRTRAGYTDDDVAELYFD